jgi:predicted RNase H-like nuclease (RuvC/YqgF family)
MLKFRILYKPEGSITWKEFIRYETKEEAISYLENVNPTLRPALITSGQSTLRAYNEGIIDYEDITKTEQERNNLQDEITRLKAENEELKKKLESKKSRRSTKLYKLCKFCHQVKICPKIGTRDYCTQCGIDRGLKLD